GAPASQQDVTFAQARAVIATRCVPCHSATPTRPGFTTAPNGAMFDTPEEIAARAPLMYQRAVVTRDMPLNNLTGITDQLRGLLPTLPLVHQRSESSLRKGTADSPLLGRPAQGRVLPTPLQRRLPP